MPVFVNEVLLEHEFPCSFTFCVWSFSHCNGRIEYLGQKLYGLQNMKYLQHDPLKKKTLLMPDIDYEIRVGNLDVPILLSHTQIEL